ncbi:MAG TPA: SDR family oxidoreductase [Actinomycetales bacterium]|nr:SDR family oxidoreductase [Actinomycetales bacterium]
MKWIGRERMPLEGTVVLVTGAGSGIGELVAVGAARRGARGVVLWDIDPVAAERVAAAVGLAGAEAYVQRVDVRDTQAVAAAAAQVLAQYGAVDVLVNNAGVVSGKDLVDLSEEEIARTFDVNVLAHYRTIRAFLPTMLQRDSGLVVTVASAAGLVGVARQTDYSASKFAAVGLTESLRAELRHRGSQVGTLLVCPYYIDTGMFEGVRTRVPLLLPILRPERVAEQVLDAIESGRQRLVLPAFAQSILFLKGLPVGIVDAVADLFGINATMDAFVGRPKSRSTRAPAE